MYICVCDKRDYSIYDWLILGYLQRGETLQQRKMDPEDPNWDHHIMNSELEHNGGEWLSFGFALWYPRLLLISSCWITCGGHVRLLTALLLLMLLTEL